MPIYEYRCPNCRKVHELWRSISETEACECPECSEPMHKLISRSSFQLKGGGWYADGYCRKGEEKGSDSKPADTAGCDTAGNKESQACTACNS
jgi:putative FmdB family regulatory protein